MCCFHMGIPRKGLPGLFVALFPTSKGTNSCFSGGSEWLPGWFVHFLAHFGNIKNIKKCPTLPTDIPQICLLVGNSEVGMIKLTHHQKCLLQLMIPLYFQMWMAGSSNMWWGGGRKFFSTTSCIPTRSPHPMRLRFSDKIFFQQIEY